MHTKRTSLLALGTIVVVGLSLIAGVASAEGKKGKRKGHKVVKQWVDGHMTLGQHYMLLGRYDEARAHFEAVANLDHKALRAKFGKPDKGAVPEEGLDELRARKGKRGKAGKGRRARRGHKPLQIKFRAHMSAAVAAHKAGKGDLAEAWAEKALEFAQSKDFDRGVKIAEKFLEEPDEVAFRHAPSVSELEKRLKKIDSELGAGK